ncbi:MAG: hypothetical protein P4M07_28835 [Xanthobacteraceae bacterium]|nr:hypothetical protein [Xanthobacteraceae bacterium]
MSLLSIATGRRAGGLAVPVWLWVGAGALVLVLLQGAMMLRDTDTYWQLRVGQWILDNHALPRVDVFSLTRAGAPWLSSSWLAQVLFAQAYALAGWTGIVALSALAIAATFALLVAVLERRLPASYAAIVAITAFALSAQHFLARPHVLAMPLMVGWIASLVSASDRRVAPSFAALPLIALWANLHGGFVLGLALVAPIALDALWNAERPRRVALALRWALFGLAAAAACCATPYGWNSLLASARILDLGELLTLISEWAPVSFASFGLFEGCLLLLIGAALASGVKLPPTRILLALGLFHMALNHTRNIEVFALLLPIVLMAPVAAQFGLRPAAGEAARPRWITTAIALVAVALAGTGVAMSRDYRPTDGERYAEAVAALRAHHATRVFNDYGFGGYMIWAGGPPPFIDGRAELYGEAFALDHLHATSLADPAGFNRLLNDWRIDATIMYPTTPAARLLDHVEGWQRVFTSELAVVHVRTASGGADLKVRD